jgi:hypothetical protein
MQLNAIERKDILTKDEFKKNYLENNKPVIFKSFCESWPAKNLWTLEYFKEKYGSIEVPLYDEAFANSGGNYLAAQIKMKFSEYLDLIAAGPTTLRMFLFNIFKYAPELCNDFSYPDITDRFLKKYPFMFFGGQTAKVDAHYDLDLSHVFLTQFCGKKRIVLFSPDYSEYLYRHPLTVSTNVDIGNPNFERYPRLQEIQGFECIVDHGDTLFIPSGYWHYIYYTEGGFSLSLRSRPEKLTRRIHGVINIFTLTIVDRLLSKLFGGQRWYAMKETMAMRKAEKIKVEL